MLGTCKGFGSAQLQLHPRRRNRRKKMIYGSTRRRDLGDKPEKMFVNKSKVSPSQAHRRNTEHKSYIPSRTTNSSPKIDCTEEQGKLEHF